MNVPAVQRKKEKPDEALDPQQIGRAWRFAELLAFASDGFGSQEVVEQWFYKPAIGLNRNRSGDPLSTPAGQDMVKSYLEQLYCGVYV